MDYPQMHAQVLTWCYCYEIPYKRKNDLHSKKKVKAQSGFTMHTIFFWIIIRKVSVCKDISLFSGIRTEKSKRKEKQWNRWNSALF